MRAAKFFKGAGGAVRWLRIARLRRVNAALFYIGARSEIVVTEHGTLRVEQGVVILQDCVVRVHGKVVINDNVFINRGAHIVARSSVTIGCNVLLGEYVSIHDDGYDLAPESLGRPPAERGFTSAPIDIGDEVWVGAKATILAGVTIGRGAVVAANSVITRDVEPYTVVAGAPARVLRRLNAAEKPKLRTINPQ